MKKWLALVVFFILVILVFVIAPGDGDLEKGKFYNDNYYVFLLLIILILIIGGIFSWFWFREPVNKFDKKK